MKIKKGFVLKQVAGNFIVVPTGSLVKNFNGVVNLNQTGAFLWSKCQDEIDRDKLIEELIKEVFSGKFDDIITLQKGNRGKKIWNGLGVIDYVLNEKEMYSLRNMGGKTFVHRAIFPNFKYNGMTLNITKDFDINKLSPKAQTIAKLAIKEYEEFIEKAY